MTQAIELRLNPDLDPADFAPVYRERKLVQIPDILPRDAADAVEAMLRRNIQWRLVFPEPSQTPGARETIVQITKQDAESMGRAAMQQRLAGVMERARENIGFLYNAYPMIEAYMKGWEPGHPIHQLTEFLNSPEFLEFGRAVIGADVITKADAQATLYRGGNFLTRHVDEGYDKERRAAYTFGFTRRWEPDWGGLLMFLDGDHNVTRGLVPRFNTLSLFDGRLLHTVSAVSPFAGAGRFQITGWLRDDPPAQAG